tara:strand:+ start:284 stop:565 length:282 start_codon:yes stop_codon:yes gene_type:complete
MTNKPINPPKKNSAEWKKNEKIINTNPTLKAARDGAQGLKKSHYGSSDAGKGSATRFGDEQAFKDNYDKIQWTKPEDKEKPKFRVRVNGKYID